MEYSLRALCAGCAIDRRQTMLADDQATASATLVGIPGSGNGRLIRSHHSDGTAYARHAKFSALLKQPPPLPIGLAPGRRLHLAPPSARTGSVGRIPALAHYAFQSVLLGHLEERQAVREGLGGEDSGTGEPAHEDLQATLSTFQRQLPQILAIKLTADRQAIGTKLWRGSMAPLHSWRVARLPVLCWRKRPPQLQIIVLALL
jgi:hypothetical protein